MKKLNYLLLLPLLMLSCSSGDEEPELPQEPQAFTVGLSDLDGVQYFNGQTISLISGNQQDPNGSIVVKDIDLNDDGTDDLRFFLTSVIDEDIQLLKVRGLNGTSLAWNDQRFELDNNSNSHLQMTMAGEVLEMNSFQWTTDESLFMLYRVRNQALSVGSFLNQKGFLPIQLNDRLGWVEFEAITEEAALDVTGIEIKQVALK